MWEDAEEELNHLMAMGTLDSRMALGYRMQIALGLQQYEKVLDFARLDDAQQHLPITGLARARLGQKQRALDVCNKLRVRKGRFGAVASILEILGDTRSALDFFEAATRREFSHQNWLGLARCLEAVGDAREAEAAYRRALAMAPYLLKDEYDHCIRTFPSFQEVEVIRSTKRAQPSYR